MTFEAVETKVLEEAPKRRGRPPGSHNMPRPEGAPRGRRPRSLETRIGATLTSFNMIVSILPPLQADALDPTEIQALAKAIDQQAQANARFRKYLLRALDATSFSGLAAVVAIIVARRVARHNLLPLPESGGLSNADVDAGLGALLAMGGGAALPFVAPSPEAVQ